MQHAADANHHFRVNDIKILTRESDWHKRGIRESIYISTLSPSLNRNEGRHDLPHCYDSLLKETIKRPTPPEVHQATEPRLNTSKRPPGRPRTTLPSNSQNDTMAKTITSPVGSQEKTAAKRPHSMTTRSRATQSAQNQGAPWSVSDQPLSPSISTSTSSLTSSKLFSLFFPL